MRRLGVQAGADPATLTEEQVRAHILRLKTAHAYAPSSMRTAVAALSAYYNLHLGHAWKLFGLVRSPDRRTLPTVLTRVQVAALLAAVREERFRALLGTIYACGLRVSEAVKLAVTDIEGDGTRVRIRGAKGDKDRLVPLPRWALLALRAYWKTHRHSTLLLFHRRPQAGTRSVTPLLRSGATPAGVTISALPRSVPGAGRGWREQPGALARLVRAVEPMGVGSVQTCLRQARADARLPKETCVHTLRHSYAMHLLEEGVSIRLISAYLGHASLDEARRREDGRSAAQARGAGRGCPARVPAQRAATGTNDADLHAPDGGQRGSGPGRAGTAAPASA